MNDLIAEQELIAQQTQRINELEAKVRELNLPHVECPVAHHFAPGLYVRQIFMPKGTFVIGAKHKTKHFNWVMSGRARVLCQGAVEEIQAPYLFVSDPGVRKVLLILEDMIWLTSHPTDETDLEVLDKTLVERQTYVLSDKEKELWLGQ